MPGRPMSKSPFDPRSLADLPEILPIFPLTGATLLPGTQLPLNIFEPRYLNMVLDALKGARMIGMVQPCAGAGEPVPVYRVGCAGRIVAFNETPDGRLLISLQGVCRFEVGEELPLERGYRRVRAGWEPFAGDLAPADGGARKPDEIRERLEAYLDRNGIRVDWESLERMPGGRMVDFLSMHLPLTPEEKQALLEASDPDVRAEALFTITDMALGAGSDDAPTRH